MASRRLELAAAASATALPVVGVTAFDWSLAVVLVAYWLELGAVFWWAVVRALLARRPTDYPEERPLVGAFRYKRGTIPLPWTDHAVRLQHLFGVLVAAVGFGAAWLFVGSMTVGGAAAAEGETALTRNGRAATLLVTAVGLFVSQGATTVEYLRDETYADVSAGVVLRRAVWPLLVGGLALAVGGSALATGATGTAVVAGVVGTKFCFDLAGIYGDRLRAYDERTSVDFGWAADPPPLRTVETAGFDPVATARPHRGAVLVSGLARGLRTDVAILAGVFGLGAVGGLLVGSPASAALFGLGIAVVLVPAALVGAGDRAVRYLWMEYRLDDGGNVVGVDRLFGAPQWRLPAWRVAAGEVVRTRVDRRFGTVTLVASDGEREIRLPHLPADAATGMGERADVTA